jgi:nucleoside-diphosphate-sugar epimerase
MPSTRYHQHTDQIVREFSSAVNVAIVSPTVVYGLSRSLGKKVPITVRDIVATVKQLSMGFTWGDGKNILGYIHVDDLAGIYVRLVADAIDKSAQREYQLWGPQAYYFATGEEMTFTTYMEALVNILRKNFILGSEVIRDFSVMGNTVEREMVDKIAAVHGCGMSVRCRSERAETLLLWKPQGPSLLETLPEIIEVLSLSVTP